MSHRYLTVLAAWLLLVAPSYAQRNYPPELKDADARVYKTVGETKLSLWVYRPTGHQASDRRPAIVFFFGGGWTGGTPGQFEQQCRYLASRGMVAITADYRVASRHQVKAVDCVRDAKSAIRWVRGHAAELGVDPEKIVASGGSAGGHLAACTGVLTTFDEPTEDRSISSRPNALVLFNPAVSFTPPKDGPARKEAANLAERLGVPVADLSPAEHVVKGLPPTQILIGTKDFLIEGNHEFASKMKAAGNRCDLVLYEGREHGFFNFGRGDNRDFRATTTAMDRFLAELGYLQGPPTVDTFFASLETSVRPR